MNEEYVRQAEQLIADFNHHKITPREYEERILELNRKYHVWPILDRKPEKRPCG